MDRPLTSLIVCFLLCLLFPYTLAALEIQLTVSEGEGLARYAEPVSTGIPLPRGSVEDISSLGLIGPDGVVVASQFDVLSTWPDGSPRWVLVSFLARCPPSGNVSYKVTDRAGRQDRVSPLLIEDRAAGLTVTTGPMRVELDKEAFNLFDRVWLDHDGDGVFTEEELVSAPDGGPNVSLVDEHGMQALSHWGEVRSFEVEENGPVRATVAVKGTLGDAEGDSKLNYTARLHFYAGTGFVRVMFSLENARPSKPLPGNHRVLDQPGNIFFEDMSLSSRLQFDGPVQMCVYDGTRPILDRVVLVGEGGIYQESSGGDNWYHRNHMIYNHRIPLTFRGAKSFHDGVQPYQIDRPDAWLHAADRKFGLAVGVRYFWQNFPKSLSAEPDGTVRVGLWPKEFPSVHELQGGEIKTHEIAFWYHTGSQGSSREVNRIAGTMAGFHHPLYVRARPQDYLAGMYENFTVYEPGRFPTFERYMQGAVMAEDENLFTQREVIDEYGWRNFGDTWAKNERNKTGGPHSGQTMVNHFNLEYDLGYGMLLQSLRTTGVAESISRKWWALAEPALLHESDIDIYHTTKEQGAVDAYAGGKFRHTAHGVEAGLSTHRAFPRELWYGELDWPWGRGGAPESGHFNNRGLVFYYYLTGNRRVLESAIEIAELVHYKISNDRYAQIDRLDRTSGNNLQVLLDAYLVTWDEKYRESAEKVLENTAPEKMWFMSEEGWDSAPDKSLPNFAMGAIHINEAARFTRMMEDKTGRPYQTGRDFVTGYADFYSSKLAGGPEHGFHRSWGPTDGGRGEIGPWTYRSVDVVMNGHFFSDDSGLKNRCLRAARDAFKYLERIAPSGDKPIFTTGKNSTMLIGGGHEYTFYRRNGGWND